MVVHFPWSRELGAGRVAVELARCFEEREVTVEKWDSHDAFPPENRLLNHRFVRFFHWAMFPARAAAFIRSREGQYDIIIAEQSTLPFSRASLRHRGLLVARSNGLLHFYRQYEDEWRRNLHQTGRLEGSLTGNLLRWLSRRVDGGLGRVNRSFREADRILLLNHDERRFVEDTLGFRGKSIVAPNGLDDERLEALRAAADSPQERLRHQEVVFIGYWCPRKGSEEFPQLVRRIRSRRPGSTFRLLGTGVSEAEVLAAFEPADRAAIHVVPFFRTEELPELLRGATVGVLPSHIEGFGIAVLEMLAAGLPAFAYDVPGPRAMLAHCNADHLLPRGKVDRLAEALLGVLELTPDGYEPLREEAFAIAGRFQWREIADQILTELLTSYRGLAESKTAQTP